MLIDALNRPPNITDHPWFGVDQLTLLINPVSTHGPARLETVSSHLSLPDGALERLGIGRLDYIDSAADLSKTGSRIGPDMLNDRRAVGIIGGDGSVHNAFEIYNQLQQEGRAVSQWPLMVFGGGRANDMFHTMHGYWQAGDPNALVLGGRRGLLQPLLIEKTTPGDATTQQRAYGYTSFGVTATVGKYLATGSFREVVKDATASQRMRAEAELVRTTIADSKPFLLSDHTGERWVSELTIMNGSIMGIYTRSRQNLLAPGAVRAEVGQPRLRGFVRGMAALAFGVGVPITPDIPYVFQIGAGSDTGAPIINQQRNGEAEPVRDGTIFTVSVAPPEQGIPVLTTKA